MVSPPCQFFGGGKEVRKSGEIVLEFDRMKVGLIPTDCPNAMDEKAVTAKDIIEGQLNARERAFITSAILDAPMKTQVALEVGTWLGGGSTLHILRALHANGVGHLWGVEASKDIYERMTANIRAAVPEAADRFTPIFGFSNKVLPVWLNGLPAGAEVDFVFLDGGDNPYEQVEEFKLLSPRIRVGGVLMAHDARTRKGKWLAHYVGLLDNWETEVFDISSEGVFRARKIKPEPSAASRKAAKRKLNIMRLEPMELVARFLPSPVCGLILRALPKRLSRRLTLGAGI
jgi:predicted O-methyltransferase YrrM